jgi:hypothetical protein
MDILNQALRRPLIRCDVPQWTLFGISLAGFNAILSLAGAWIDLRIGAAAAAHELEARRSARGR